MADRVQWLTTAPNPRSPATGFDAGQRGWARHAVKAEDKETFAEVGSRPAACGLRPVHGWGMDLFVTRKCKHCIRARGNRVCQFCYGMGCAACKDGENESS